MRQAVVVIHGIGRQRPLDTLRRFMDGLIGEGNYWSKPDRLQGSADLRRFTAEGSRQRHPTDFFEMYWSPQMVGGRPLSTYAWLAVKALVPFWRTDYPLPGVRFTLQFGLLAIVVFAAIWGAPTSAEALLSAPALALALAVGAAGRFAGATMTDAERYLNSHPRNILDRDRVREVGMDLLRTLHRDGEYFRIIIVGHSLGSVIGYDLIRHLWDDFRQPFHVPTRVQQPAAKSFDKEASALAEVAQPKPVDVENYQQLQHRLWRENRSHGVPWLITDFVTLGSPLAHARSILSSGIASFERRVQERELPVCPPHASTDGEVHYLTRFQGMDELGITVKRDLRIAHHAGPFSCTRWTNLYYPSRGLIVGDLVGGALSPALGVGIRDVPVRAPHSGFRGMVMNLFPICHTGYWATNDSSPKRQERKDRDRATGTKEVSLALRAAMRLDTHRSREKWPSPTHEA